MWPSWLVGGLAGPLSPGKDTGALGSQSLGLPAGGRCVLCPGYLKLVQFGGCSLTKGRKTKHQPLGLRRVSA